MKTPRKITQAKKRQQASFPESNLGSDLFANLTRIKTDFGQNNDLVVNVLQWDDNPACIYAVLYLISFTNKDTINSLSDEIDSLKNKVSTKETYSTRRDFFSGIRVCKEGSKLMDLYAELLSGNMVFLVNGSERYFSVLAENTEGRAVEEPSAQTVIRGPKDGFTENLNQNIFLVRKRIKNTSLKLENLSVGKLTKTAISLMYIKGIAKESIIQEIRDRINRIEIDSILEGAYIEEWIKDDRYSIFPVFLSSEKPDSVAAALTEGKVAIFTDGTPYVLSAPAVMVDFFHSSEDYYHHFIISSLMRILRYMAFFITLLTPALYIGITTFHHEMIPTQLLISIAAQREGVPFSTFLEGLILEVTFEVLREAGVRMPRAIGPAISIVGALVLGQAAVDAGIFSAAIVIVVSITAISSFSIPNYEMSNAIRTARFVFMVLAGLIGLYGIFVGLIVLTLHLCKIKSIGIPYMTPIAPHIKGGNKDTFFRFPLWSMKKRPYGIHGIDERRVADEYDKQDKTKDQEFR